MINRISILNSIGMVLHEELNSVLCGSVGVVSENDCSIKTSDLQLDLKSVSPVYIAVRIHWMTTCALLEMTLADLIVLYVHSTRSNFVESYSLRMDVFLIKIYNIYVRQIN